MTVKNVSNVAISASTLTFVKEDTAQDLPIGPVKSCDLGLLLPGVTKFCDGMFVSDPDAGIKNNRAVALVSEKAPDRPEFVKRVVTALG
ncbi:hypothetical protein [Streptomyces sp. NPDC053431]|uniref:hypothetical protein n=1 Tax=Streptomyces sp. NPDC053431 TaxID=3365703 RepID=UPI0037D16F93